MGRTEVYVFLVAMAILPFLQNMLLNIGTGHDMHVHIHNLSAKTLAKKKSFRILSPFQKITLAETIHSIPKVLGKGNPLSWTFCIWIHKCGQTSTAGMCVSCSKTLSNPAQQVLVSSCVGVSSCKGRRPCNLHQILFESTKNLVLAQLAMDLIRIGYSKY